MRVKKKRRKGEEEEGLRELVAGLACESAREEKRRTG